MYKLHVHEEHVTVLILNYFALDLDAPRDVQVISQTDDSISLEWSNSEADVDNYRVKYNPISGGSHGEELFPCGPGDTTEATITGETNIFKHQMYNSVSNIGS